MPITVTDSGKNNVVVIDQDIIAQGRGTILLTGDNNRISIKSPALKLGLHFHLNGGADVEVGANLNAGNLFVYAVTGARLRIGQVVGFNGAVRLLMHEAATLVIGDGCLFGSDVDVSISDMHSIIDLTTRERLNPARDIHIGKRVWVGQRTLIMKGATIGEGCAIGAGSIVTKPIPDHCVAAGSPAKVIRRNATWDFRLL